MFLQELTYGNKYAAVEHTENGMIYCLELVKKKDELLISNQFESDVFDEVLKGLKKQKHLFLVLNNEQVLSKKIPFTDANDINSLRIAFPNISISDFYVEIYHTKTTSFIAIARKEVVDTLITKYQEKGIMVIDFSLGNLVFKNLIPFIDNNIFYSSNAKIEILDTEVVELEKEPTSTLEYTINDLKIYNYQLLSLAGVICYYSKNTASKIQKQLSEKYLHKRFFDIGLKTGLGFLLVILLVNFFFFSNYRDKVGALEGELQLSTTYKKQFNNLQKEVIQKKRLVASVNAASKVSITNYFDDLGSSVPNTILLSQINYQPLKGVQKDDKKIIFDFYMITVKGTSKENENFTNWISLLENKKWIKKIAILEYGKGSKNTSIANFELNIVLNE